MKMKISTLFENYDRQTDRPIDRHTDRRIHKEVKLPITLSIRDNKLENERGSWFTYAIHMYERINENILYP